MIHLQTTSGLHGLHILHILPILRDTHHFRHSRAAFGYFAPAVVPQGAHATTHRLFFNNVSR